MEFLKRLCQEEADRASLSTHLLLCWWLWCFWMGVKDTAVGDTLAKTGRKPWIAWLRRFRVALSQIFAGKTDSNSLSSGGLFVALWPLNSCRIMR